MNRKWFALVLACVLLLSLAAACGRKDDAGNAQNNDTNNEMTTPTENVGSNTNTPGNMAPGNQLGNYPDTPDDPNYRDPVFPDSLATMDAEVAVDDLFDTIGLTRDDLDTAMRDFEMAEGGTDDVPTYRHKLLGMDADISYGFDDDHIINKVTVKTQPDSADEWRQELSGILGAVQAEDDPNSWMYNDNQVKVSEMGDHVVITIGKKA
ncbi:MAG: hypothetical protein IKU58_04155 [Clostridia bacterium]|nr:hypothetical protein [Clostridia bacterium]